MDDPITRMLQGAILMNDGIKQLEEEIDVLVRGAAPDDSVVVPVAALMNYKEVFTQSAKTVLVLVEGICVLDETNTRKPL